MLLFCHHPVLSNNILHGCEHGHYKTMASKCTGRGFSQMQLTLYLHLSCCSMLPTPAPKCMVTQCHTALLRGAFCFCYTFAMRVFLKQHVTCCQKSWTKRARRMQPTIASGIHSSYMDHNDNYAGRRFEGCAFLTAFLTCHSLMKTCQWHVLVTLCVLAMIWMFANTEPLDILNFVWWIQCPDSLWLTRHLSELDAGAGVPAALMPYVSVAWRFLNAAGYINFGVAPELAQTGHAQCKGRIIVVGAGLAGGPAALYTVAQA